MMNRVNDYIMIQNLIPAQVCKFLIKENSLPEKKWSKHSWYSYGKEDSYSLPDKELDIIEATFEEFPQLLNYLREAVHNYQQKYSSPKDEIKTRWIKHISPPRINRYKVGTKMRAHYDHIHSLFDGDLRGVPILSFVGLLNDNYKGGEFMCRNKKIKLKRGDILMFPSNFMYPHEVKEVTKGIRYSFVGWAF